MDQLFIQIAELILNKIKLEFMLQGHHLSGKFEQNLTYQINNLVQSVAIDYTMPDYGAYLENGVTAARIPFGGINRTGGTSKYIQGLKDYFMRRMSYGEKEALKAAFALSMYRKKNNQGMPTDKSYRFTQTGKRTGFIGDAVDLLRPDIENIIRQYIDDTVNFALNLQL